MRICIIGKYPPIQGGVSMRTYWTAHRLAARGHEIHVVTNAKEALPPFRMHMREVDWQRCEASYGPGSVTVHWTDPVDRSQSYLPMASPFVSKLATIAATAHSARPFDVICSHYMEPYGVAGHLASQMTGLPHVVRMAGSDAGRLWHHPQLEVLYDHVLRCAEVVIVAGMVAQRAMQRGVDPRRIAAGGGYALPEELFTPEGPALEPDVLRTELAEGADLHDALWGDFAADRPYFGIYGKLGETKGSFAILSAMHRLKLAGVEVGLVALAHGRPDVERRFRERARELGLADRILQIPFLPHWRVPEFLRGCLAVCCLEQDFPIGFHSPITPLEVLLCGACLVGSTEIIRKLPQSERLPYGYGCVAIEDVNDVESLSGKLAAIVHDPEPAAVVGARGCAFARELQRDIDFPQRLERILEAAMGRRPLPSLALSGEAETETTRFPLTQIAAAAIAEKGDEAGTDSDPTRPEASIDLARAENVLARIERAIADGQTSLQSLAQAVQIEIAIAIAEGKLDASIDAMGADRLPRLSLHRWAIGEGGLGALVPIRAPQLRVLQFDYDVSEFHGARAVADFPPVASSRSSAIVVFGQSEGSRPEPLLVDNSTARILQLSDGTRTVAEIARQVHRHGDAAPEDDLTWIEKLFVCGFIRLEQTRTACAHPTRMRN